MQPALLGEPLDGRDRAAILHDRELKAGVHAYAVDQHRAGATLAMVAALLGAGEIEVLAQEVEQRRPGCDGECLLSPLIVRLTVASGNVGALIWVLELTSIVSQTGWLPANQRACAQANAGPCRVRPACGAAPPACRPASRRRCAVCSLFFQPLTTSPSPFIIASKPTCATSAGSSFFACADLGVHHVGALEELRLRRAGHQAGDGDAACPSARAAARRRTSR